MPKKDMRGGNATYHLLAYRLPKCFCRSIPWRDHKRSLYLVLFLYLLLIASWHSRSATSKLLKKNHQAIIVDKLVTPSRAVGSPKCLISGPFRPSTADWMVSSSSFTKTTWLTWTLWVLESSTAFGFISLGGSQVSGWQVDQQSLGALNIWRFSFPDLVTWI